MVDYYNYKMSGSEEEPESHSQPGMTKAELRRVKFHVKFFEKFRKIFKIRKSEKMYLPIYFYRLVIVIFEKNVGW